MFEKEAIIQKVSNRLYAWSW